MEKIIFTCYRKVLVFNFSVVGSTVFIWAKKLMERWYLLVTENFLFWTFRWWGIRSFFQPKSWWKDDIYLVFFSFPWYSRTWEIRFFVQCKGSATYLICLASVNSNNEKQRFSQSRANQITRLFAGFSHVKFWREFFFINL